MKRLEVQTQLWLEDQFGLQLVYIIGYKGWNRYCGLLYDLLYNQIAGQIREQLIRLEGRL